MTLLSEFRRKVWIKDEYNSKSTKLPFICMMLFQQIQQLQHWNILGQRGYDSKMDELAEVKRMYDSLPNRLSFADFKTKSCQSVMLELNKVWHLVKEIIEFCGCPMDVFLDFYDIPELDFWSLHQDIFTITDVYEVCEKKNKREYDELCELATNENNTDYENTPFVTRKYPYVSITLIEKVSGAFLVYHRNNKFLKISGIYNDDALNFIRCIPEHIKKNIEIKTRINDLSFPLDFCIKYYNALNVRDFMAFSVDEIIGKIVSGGRELKRLKGRELSELIREFNVSSKESKIRMICILGSGDEAEHMKANSIFSAMNTNWPRSELKEFYQRLPWEIQSKIDNTAHTVNEFNRLLTIALGDIPLEEQIVMMTSSDEIKSKATQKLKEIKGARENAPKAEQYLRGLLKVPFGKYRKEPMFSFMEDGCSNYRKALDEMITMMKKLKTEKNVTELENSFNTHSELTYKSTNILMNDANTYGVKFINSLLGSDTSMASDDEYLSMVKKWLSLVKQQEEWLKQNGKRKQYLDQTKEILDECVHGHKDAKEKIQRLVSQWMNGKMEGAVFGFQGPPGVGKTTLAKEGLSRCLLDDKGDARPFCFLPLGGASSGSILEGHSYTYVGSTWGRIVDMLMTAKCMNPIIYIDELDKISHTEHGREIIGILTHITDPSQNKEFNDRYFAGIDIDLSKVLFVFSYNDTSAIDGILRDRITEINIDPLTLHDKKIIVKKHIVPQLCSMVGFNKDDIIIPQEIIEHIVNSYTYEAGVRKLKEIITDLLRDINMKTIQDKTILFPYTIEMKDVDHVMHRKHKVLFKKISPIPRVGIINGLYATAGGGGGLTMIQVLATPSKGELTLELTGLQGETMKESMSCAKTIATSILCEVQKLKLKSRDTFGLHIHCPSAGMKKDGPSAGAAITCAILSRICDIPTINTVAMTGEIDLYGNVTAIGGLDCKINGAYKAGVKKILCPKQNEHDYMLFKEHLEDNDEDISKYPEVVLVETIFDVIPHVFDVKLDDYFCKSWF